MSLLLDALKKAAQENKNSSATDIAPETQTVPGELEADQIAPDNAFRRQEAEPLQELELHDEVLTLSDPAEEVASQQRADLSSTDTQYHRMTPTPSTVTDEALQLLIHKTNRAHRKSRVLTWGGIVTSSVILLLAGGLYFYYDMMAEIETMQRKHQLALAALKSKTMIEENLTSLADAPDSVTRVKPADKPGVRKLATASQPKPRIRESASTVAGEQTFSVQRAQRRDPISEALQRAWKAYHDRDYALSNSQYKYVLEQEPRNHDALLGLAAVSMQQNDVDTAREMYIKLLELDPRDPHAHAGLANIAQKTGGELSETRLKQLIEYRPEDAHLQFALGNLYIQKQSWPEAQQAFFNAWKADSRNPDYAYNLAVSLDHLGQHKAAKAYYQDSLELAVGKNVSFSADAVKTRLSSLSASQ